MNWFSYSYMIVKVQCTVSVGYIRSKRVNMKMPAHLKTNKHIYKNKTTTTATTKEKSTTGRKNQSKKLVTMPDSAFLSY